MSSDYNTTVRCTDETRLILKRHAAQLDVTSQELLELAVELLADTIESNDGQLPPIPKPVRPTRPTVGRSNRRQETERDSLRPRAALARRRD